MVFISKLPALVEDIEFGFGASEQERGGTKFNSAYLPYTDTESVTEALDNRYTKAYIDTNYAKIGGDATQLFLVANGVSGNQSVNFNQLDLKEDKTVVIPYEASAMLGSIKALEKVFKS